MKAAFSLLILLVAALPSRADDKSAEFEGAHVSVANGG